MQSTIGLRAIVLRVIVRKGIVLGGIFACAAIFRGLCAPRWVHTLIDTIGRSSALSARSMIVIVADLLLRPTSFPLESSCSRVLFGPRATANADGGSDTTLDAEHLDLSRFNSAAHEQSLRRHPKKRYHDRSIGIAVVVAMGNLELVLWLWPEVRIVLAMEDQIGFTRSKLPWEIRYAGHRAYCR